MAEAQRQAGASAVRQPSANAGVADPRALAPPRLLDDAAMQRFVRDGYVTLASELPRPYHERMLTALETLDEGGPRGHNNLLPCVPELSRLLDEPGVRGALTSILGPGYYLHFHRHDHFNFPSEAQPLHKDGDNHSHAAVDGLRRMHRTRYVMLFYYPQDTPLEKGPTAIVPGSQYTPRRALEAARAQWQPHAAELHRAVLAKFGARALFTPEGRAALDAGLAAVEARHPALAARRQQLDAPWEAARLPLTGQAGTIAVVHFDMVHGRYGGNATSEPRHMVKFLFARDRDPLRPSWQGGKVGWPGQQGELDPLWQSMWDWHRGALAAGASAADGERRQWTAALGSQDDAVALGAAYSLGRAASGGDGRALATLVEAFLSDCVDLRTMAAYGLVAADRASVSELRERLRHADAALAARILDLLGDIGAGAQAALADVVEALRHGSSEVRRYAAEALGTIGQGSAPEAAVLAAPLADADALVRRNAALAAARLGGELRRPDCLVPLLADNLFHLHHHVRGWSIEALLRLDSDAAAGAARRYLMAARWDPAPKSGDRP